MSSLTAFVISCFSPCPLCSCLVSFVPRMLIKELGTQCLVQVFGTDAASQLLYNYGCSERRNRDLRCFCPQTKKGKKKSNGLHTTHAPGVPACWPMRGSSPSWTGVVSGSAVITMVFSSISSQVGLEKADRGSVILCISRSYTLWSCCFFKSRPLNTKKKAHGHGQFD